MDQNRSTGYHNLSRYIVQDGIPQYDASKQHVSKNARELMLKCNVSEWSNWSPCTQKCDGGTQTRFRNTAKMSRDGNHDCLTDTQTRPCNLSKCPIETHQLLSPNIRQDPIDCKLSEWTGWSDCSKGTSADTQYRKREVLQKPMYNGKPCDKTIEVRKCTPNPRLNCKVSDWGEWSACVNGQMTRQRDVLLQPNDQGEKCPHLIEYSECDIGKTDEIIEVHQTGDIDEQDIKQAKQKFEEFGNYRQAPIPYTDLDFGYKLRNYIIENFQNV